MKQDPARLLLLLALVLATALYAPTLGRGALDHDDTWLLRDNWIANDASWSSLRAIMLDAHVPIRAVLGAEYLPVRDVVAMTELAVFGHWWPGFHAVSLALYLAAIALWFAALCAFGVPRTLAALAMLLWAVHPTHAESVAWLAEQKGLLALVATGACVLGYARYRAGARARYLALAVAAAIVAVWSKAPAAFAIAALGPLELVLPGRESGRRSARALVVIAAACLGAFLPVLVVATKLSVVAPGEHAPAGWAAMVAGTHGFYVKLALMIVPNAASYPLGALGPSALDIVIGTLALIAVFAVAAWPRLRARAELRAGCVLWLFGWLPASRLVLPVRHVAAADRYLSFATLGLALAAAAGICALASRRARIALASALVLAGGLRTLAAQAAWRDDVSLWAHAVDAYPSDGEAWARYSEALEAAGDRVGAAEAIDRGLERSHHPRLLVDQARRLFDENDRVHATALLREAADAGEPYGMLDLALVLDLEGQHADALAWARRALAAAGEHAEVEDDLCRIALHAGAAGEALAACERAHAMRPADFAIALHLEQARRAE